MKKFDNILDIFPSDKLREEINDLVEIIDNLSKRLPAIATSRVEIINSTFYDGMSYKEFAEWIDKRSKEIAGVLLSEKRLYTEDVFLEQANAVNRLFDVLVVLWWKCYPDLATECCIMMNNGDKTSLAGVVFKAIECNLSVLGYKPKGFITFK